MHISSSTAAAIVWSTDPYVILACEALNNTRVTSEDIYFSSDNDYLFLFNCIATVEFDRMHSSTKIFLKYKYNESLAQIIP